MTFDPRDPKQADAAVERARRLRAELEARGVLRPAVAAPDGDRPAPFSSAAMAEALALDGEAEAGPAVEVEAAAAPAVEAGGGAGPASSQPERDGRRRRRPRSRLARPDPAEDTPSADIAAVRAAEVTPERVQWLWPGRIARGKLTILEGTPEQGKSTLTIDIAARLTTGTPFPDGHRPDPAPVLLAGAEDGVADTVVPRLHAAGAKLDHVLLLDHVRDETGPRPFELPGDLDRLGRLIEREGIRLVVLDPLMAFLASRVDSHRDQDVRRALHPLKDMAETTGTAVIVVRHWIKSSFGDPLTRGGGSIGLTGAARIVLAAGTPSDDEEREQEQERDDGPPLRVLATSKCNIGPRAPSLAYKIVADELYDAPRIVWEGVCEYTAADLAGGWSPGRRSRPKQESAERWLQELLASGPQRVEMVKARAAEQGLSWRVVERAKRALGVLTSQPGAEGRRGRGPAVWHLPDPPSTRADGEQIPGEANPQVSGPASPPGFARHEDGEQIGGENAQVSGPASQPGFARHARGDGEQIPGGANAQVNSPASQPRFARHEDGEQIRGASPQVDGVADLLAISPARSGGRGPATWSLPDPNQGTLPSSRDGEQTREGENAQVNGPASAPSGIRASSPARSAGGEQIPGEANPQVSGPASQPGFARHEDGEQTEGEKPQVNKTADLLATIPSTQRDGEQCCNGGPLQPACQLCEHSPTYWRNRT